MSQELNDKLSALKARASLYNKIRLFFAKKNVLEVETPLLGLTTVTSPYISSLQVINSPSNYYLQTSPEYAMKRLLCEYPHQSIYQICKAFRKEEIGSLHHIEFSMLEWYRLNFSIFDLMNEIEELVNLFKEGHPSFPSLEITRYTYQEVFLKYLNIDPLEISYSDLLIKFKELIIFQSEDSYNQLDFDDMLQQLFCKYIEPNLQAVFVYYFPKSQAALAKINKEDSRCANRFELYLNGIEIANGYDELLDAISYRKRFADENKIREENGVDIIEFDHTFLAALENSNNLPNCSGVALGLDRILMYTLSYINIEDVISFRF